MNPKIKIIKMAYNEQPDSALRFAKTVDLLLGVSGFDAERRLTDVIAGVILGPKSENN